MRPADEIRQDERTFTVPEAALIHDAAHSHESIYRTNLAFFEFEGLSTLDLREVQPQVPVVVVLAEDDLPVRPGQGVSELIAIPPLFEN